MFVTGIVLSAGGSHRLGQPKQLLPYLGATLLESTLDVARSCGFDQLLLTLGGASESIRDQVDVSGTEIVENPDFRSGCGSSISTAIERVDPRADGVVLLLGDQPGIRPNTAKDLVRRAAGSPIGVCRYLDGLGHPFWFGREVFDALGRLQGDKALWKLLNSGLYDAAELPLEEPVPLDVDTWDDYRRLVASNAGAEVP